MYNARTGQTMEPVAGTPFAKYGGNPFSAIAGGRRQAGSVPGMADISSGFRPPRAPFQTTESDVSQAVADNFQNADPAWLRHTLGPRGSSGVARSAATDSLIAPHLAQANVQSRMAQAMIPYQQGMQNAQYNLGYQGAKAGDVLGQANNLFSRQQMQDNYDLEGQMGQMGLLGQLMQMLGGMGGGFGQQYLG